MISRERFNRIKALDLLLMADGTSRLVAYGVVNNEVLTHKLLPQYFPPGLLRSSKPPKREFCNVWSYDYAAPHIVGIFSPKPRP